MLQPRDRFGSVGGHFYEAGLAKTPHRRTQRIMRTRSTYVRKTRSARKQKRKAHPFLLLALFFELLGLALTLDVALRGKSVDHGSLIPGMWFVIMGGAFFTLSQQKRQKQSHENEES